MTQRLNGIKPFSPSTSDPSRETTMVVKQGGEMEDRARSGRPGPESSSPLIMLAHQPGVPNPMTASENGHNEQTLC